MVDRPNVSSVYGSAHHRNSVAESTMDGYSPSWQNDGTTPSQRRFSLEHGVEPYKRPAFITTVSLDEASWSGESGHTTPTRESNSPGKRTPRAGSPVDLDLTPKITESFIRPIRGSL
jgi:hypothetical protein